MHALPPGHNVWSRISWGKSVAGKSILSRLGRKLVIGVAIGGLVYVLVVVYSGWTELSQALASFRWWLFPLLLLLAFANYVFRFFKWDYYLGALDIKVKKSDSFIIFLSGLIMTISPGKIGELLKTVLLKQINRTPISVSAPIVVAERLTDFVALVVLSLAGLTMFTVEGSSVAVLITVAVTLGLFVTLVGSRRFCLWLIGVVERIDRLAHLGQRLHAAYDSIYRLVRFTPLLVATVWSLLAWFCECLGFWITLTAFVDDPHLVAATFIYALGTIMGVVSPGGLGVTEGSMLGMLQSSALMGEASLAKAPAAAATLIIRVATLWFAVAVGAVVLLLFQGRFGDAASELDEELARK